MQGGRLNSLKDKRIGKACQYGLNVPWIRRATRMTLAALTVPPAGTSAARFHSKPG